MERRMEKTMQTDSISDIRHEHEQLISEYFSMWVKRKFDRFDSIFDPACHYEECDGSLYIGRESLQAWIEGMLASQVVTAWKIHDCFHADDAHTLTVTWTFTDDTCSFDGVSVIRFNQGNRIDYVREYATWNYSTSMGVKPPFGTPPFLNGERKA